jgi:hypothetical protein
MQIGVCQMSHETTALALAARRRRGRTQEVLGEPEGEPLLTDAAWALEKHARGQRSAADRMLEPGSKLDMTEQWYDRHFEKNSTG